MEDERTDEDRIIEAIVLEGNQSLYEDIDFLPLRQSLYNVENIIPEYDDEVAPRIEWQRPNMLSSDPQYFNPDNRQLSVRQGTLPDHTFLGTLMAICAFSKYDLIENIFASRPEDFLKYGIYTCRFYVDGEWVEVITDTNLPALKNNITGDYYPAYGSSDDSKEMWVAFVEKAFAKAMGSYEEIPNIKVQKALLHLTGGSLQQMNIKEECNRLDAVSDVSSWNEFKRKLEDDSIVLMMPIEKHTGATAATEESPPDAAATTASGGDVLSQAPTVMVTHENYFVPEMLYSVVLCRDMDGYELVLMHNPWVNNVNYVWTGEWSDSSNDWDLYPELLVELEKDPQIPWRRRDPKGYFWISFRQLVKHFNTTYYCKLFPHDKFSFYCVRGECRGRHAGGPLNPVRNSDIVLKDAAAARTRAIQKATAAVVVDGDASWFNNPQFRLTCPGPGTTLVYLSIVPLGTGEEGALEQAQNVHITVTSQPKAPNQQENLWEISNFEVVDTDRREATARLRGQETSIWGLELNPKHFYHIVANTNRRGVEGDFILRVFSTQPVVMESVVPMTQYTLPGEWRRVGDIDSTGGPLKTTHSDGSQKENPKWCQNPQYHLELADPYGKDEIYLKVVVRRTDSRHAGRGSGGAAGKAGGHSAVEQKKMDAMVGIVITKADLLEDPSTKAKKKKVPKQNVLGEPLPMKVSTLKKARDIDVEEAMRKLELETPKTILRKLTVDPSSYHLATTFSSKSDSCVFFPKIPRAWVPNGLLIVPCLSERGVKGSFELEVYASERVYLNQLPETYSRTIAGEWTEASAGGSHLVPQTWKKNPKFTLKFHYPVSTEEAPRVRITVARHGSGWRNTCKRDTVGSMIGFYVFVNHSGELRPFYESTFVPDETVCTEADFVMPQLQHGEVYTIMPTTFSEGKSGSFVISILSEYEFAITKDKN